MKKLITLLIFMTLGIGLCLALSAGGTVCASVEPGLLQGQGLDNTTLDSRQKPEAQLILLAKVSGDDDKNNLRKAEESDKPDLRYVDWSKPSSVGKKNGDSSEDENGEDENDESESEKKEDEEPEEEGFDRLWDVVLYG